jgi:hypothetical protein
MVNRMAGAAILRFAVLHLMGNSVERYQQHRQKQEYKWQHFFSNHLGTTLTFLTNYRN